ncbi:MAG: hypothetical protein KDB23_14515 [Planctomycetales bacterium]|nr:hypothetical protein [Planctomycetales bacterium]
MSTLALSGESAPGLPENIRFRTLNNPVFDRLGNAAFQSSLRDIEMPDTVHDPYQDMGWWQGTNANDLELLARLNQTTFKTTDGVVAIVAANESVFGGGHLLAAQQDDDGQHVWQAQRGVAELVLDGAAYSPGSYTLFDSLEINSTGTLAIAVGQWSVSSRILFGQPGNLAVLAETGQQAVGFPQGVVYGTDFDFGGFFSPLNDHGDYAYAGTVNSHGASQFDEQAVWTHDSQGTRLVVRSDEVDALLNASTMYFVNLQMGANGELVFRSYSEAASPDSDPPGALWAERMSGGVSLIAREGEPWPNAEDATLIATIDWNTAVNSNGNLAVTATLVDGRTGIWLGTPDNMRLAVTSGQDSRFDDQFLVLGDTMLNDRDQMRFSAWNSRGLGEWLLDENGKLHRVFGAGDNFEVSVGDIRKISGYTHGNENLSDDGKIVATLHFEDGSSGVFLWQLVPEPNGLGLTTLGLAAVVVVGRRHHLR